MKLAGNLINNDGSLWCNVLCNKYIVSNMVDYNSKLTDSKLLKNIIKLKPELLEHACWITSDREIINPWTNCWIDKEMSIKDMRLKVLQELQKVKLKDLVGEEGSCNWHILRLWISVSLLQKIKVMLLPNS